MAARVRLDRLLVESGLVETRERAARHILAGEVLVDGQRVDKAGALVPATARLELLRGSPYVSRGGEKLGPVLDELAILVRGRVCLDVGASTGGFTDCLLQRGATRVYAVDVGTAQLDGRLRGDPRVVVMEQVNARNLDPRMFPEPPELAVIDVSFISLEKILPAVFPVVAPGADVVALVKPQFEVGRGQVGKGGVVRDPEQHRAVVTRVARYAVLHGWHVLAVRLSPLRGPKGNREFFLHLSTRGKTAGDLEAMIERCVEATA